MQNEVICFHNPNEVNGYLSNWYLSDFIWNGISFTSMEQYMMYRKAIVCHDTDTANRITTTPFGTACGKSLYMRVLLKNSNKTMK